MVDLNDYLPGGSKVGQRDPLEPLVKEADPELERLLAEENEIEQRTRRTVSAREAARRRPTIGDYVLVHQLDDGDVPLPQIVLITADDRDSTPYFATFRYEDGDPVDLYFDEDDCRLCSDAEAEAFREGLKVDEDRPSVGDLVIVERLDVHDERLPQVVRIDRDDHDSAPYRATFIQNQWWFSESDCKPYTGDRTDVPFMLNDDDGGAAHLIKGFEIGDRIRITEDGDDDLVGELGEIAGFDEDDEDAPFLVKLQDDGRNTWVARVEKFDEDESGGANEAFIAKTMALVDEVNAARNKLLAQLGSITDIPDLARTLKRREFTKIQGLKTLRTVYHLGLREAIEVWEKA